MMCMGPPGPCATQEDEMARIAFAMACASATLVVQAAPPLPTVYLDDRATWDALEREQPQRYAKILEIMKIAEAEPCDTAATMLKTKLDVKAKCEAMVLYTSLPAKTRLQFTLEDTNYAVFVAQERISYGRVFPAR